MTALLDWLATLPQNPCQERDDLILKAVEDNIAFCNWIQVTSNIDGHEAVFWVSDDAVRVEDEEGYRFRVPASADLTQRCADALECSLLTSKVCDLAYLQSEVKLEACPLSSGSDMVTIAKSEAFNKRVEEKRADRRGLIRDCGKTWILSNRLVEGSNVAANYGFYSSSAPYKNSKGISMWQTVGTRHDRQHVDYSQVILLMQKECQLDGETVQVEELMRDKKLCALISDEGVLKMTRL